MTFNKWKRSNQLCACGCGEYTLVNSTTRKPNKYLQGHNRRVFTNHTGKNHYNWKGGQHIHRGYVFVWCKNHPYANARNYVRRSHLIVEKALGKYLSKKVIIHHFNEIKTDDSPKNLVACEDQAYHFLLHRRKNALDICGHADWLKCQYCKQYDDPKNLYVLPNKPTACHRECRRKYYNKNKEKLNKQKRKNWNVHKDRYNEERREQRRLKKVCL